MLPIEERLENANTQVKDLQEYILLKNQQNSEATKTRHEQYVTYLKKIQDKNLKLTMENESLRSQLNCSDNSTFQARANVNKGSDAQTQTESQSVLQPVTNSSIPPPLHQDLTPSPPSITSGIPVQQMVLLNNFIRQAQTFILNMDDQESPSCSKMKTKLNTMAEEQKITMWDEEEEPDSTLITQTLVQDITEISLDLVDDLIKVNTDLQRQSTQAQAETQPSSFTLDIDMTKLKLMQAEARKERKACHHIIVEIEK